MFIYFYLLIPLAGSHASKLLAIARLLNHLRKATLSAWPQSLSIAGNCKMSSWTTKGSLISLMIMTNYSIALMEDRFVEAVPSDA